MPVFSKLLNATANYRTPILRTLVPNLGLVYCLQGLAAIPSVAYQTEKFYDLSGSVTYISATVFSLLLPAIRARRSGEFLARHNRIGPSILGLVKGVEGRGYNWRQVVISAAVTVWALRLGSFLFARIHGDGKDSRFDKIRNNPAKFAGAFMAQATWITLCLLPVLCLNSIPGFVITRALPMFTTTDAVGLTLFGSGLLFEIIADRQKSVWVVAKKNKEHDEAFLTTGLWSRSRHPNYFGEITLWSGIAVTCWGVLSSPVGLRSLGANAMGMGGGGKALAAAICVTSPAFVTFLLTKVSGIPLSEGKYDRKFGHRADYCRWKRETPVLIPRLVVVRQVPSE